MPPKIALNFSFHGSVYFSVSNVLLMYIEPLVSRLDG